MKVYKFTLLASILFLFFACGEKKEKQVQKEEIQLKSPDPTTSNAAITEVTLLATDQMTFNKKEIHIPAGKPVRLTLKHIGTMSVQVMGHNFVLLKEGVTVPGFAMKAVDAKDNDYIPEGTEDVIAHTKMLGGGESDTIEFEAPAPGIYLFLCSFPGHYSLMQGKFIVE